MPGATLLVIEDEPAMAAGLHDALGFEGFQILNAETGEQGIERARQDQPDLIVLDLMLPDINGYQVCEAIRRTSPLVPILMLTARSQESDKVRGFKVGADDYVTKPFGIAELVARLQALLRRSRRVGTELEVISVGTSQVDLRRQTVTRVRQVHDLSVYETELLRLLYDRKNEAVSRNAILDAIWGIDALPTNRTVDNVIVKLRRKLEDNPKEPKHILTVYGMGYRLVP